jgi:hypothetical protein
MAWRIIKMPRLHNETHLAPRLLATSSRDSTRGQQRNSAPHHTTPPHSTSSVKASTHCSGWIPFHSPPSTIPTQTPQPHSRRRATAAIDRRSIPAPAPWACPPASRSWSAPASRSPRWSRCTGSLGPASGCRLPLRPRQRQPQHQHHRRPLRRACPPTRPRPLRPSLTQPRHSHCHGVRRARTPGWPPASCTAPAGMWPCTRSRRCLARSSSSSATAAQSTRLRTTPTTNHPLRSEPCSR